MRAREDTGRLSDPARDEAFYASTQTYGLPVVFAEGASALEDLGKLAPEAGYLLTSALSSLTLEEADQIFTETEGPGGGFLDDGSAFWVCSWLNLYGAAGLTKQRAARKPQRRQGCWPSAISQSMKAAIEGVLWASNGTSAT